MLLAWSVIEVANVFSQSTPSKDSHFGYAVVRQMEMGECRWTQGFWHQRLTAVQQVSVPQMWDTMTSDQHTQFLSNFKIAAGQLPGKHRGPSWNDGDFYKWLEAASAVYAQTNDEAIGQKLDQGIRVVCAAQRPDGYIHTPIQIRNRLGDASAIPFSEPLQFELYNFGHLITAGCVHYRCTGKRDLLDAAIRVADFLERQVLSPDDPLGRTAICPSHYMGLIELGRLLSEPRYIQLAGRLIAKRDQVVDGTDDNQDRVPLRQQKQVVGHAVRANYLYAGVADWVLESGDPELVTTLQTLWEDVVRTKLYITGACGALYDGASPDGSASQKSISRTHQAYGRAYQLPNSTAHNESCASVGNILWNWRMLLAFGDSKYADVMERSLYNGLLASISLDGDKYFYTNTLRQLDTMPVPLRWSRERQAFISCYCCPPNVVRTIARAHELAYGRSDASIWVHLYGANRLTTRMNDELLVIEQITEYPWSGQVTMCIEQTSSKPWALKMRIPSWAESAEVYLNGKRVENTGVPGTYASVNRTWKAGDQVQLLLPMPVQKMESHPLVEETRNHVALQRGPLVYCLESKDLPEGTGLLNASVPLDSEFSTFVNRQLPGIVSLRATLSTHAGQDWSRHLYRPRDSKVGRSVEAQFIPYFAWGNRGSSEMSVWIPLGTPGR
jgi:DUF1680 family protein